MTLSKSKVRNRYDSTAKYYDFALKLYALIGIGKTFRKRAVSLLRLKRGDCVVELGCGTGINFLLVIAPVGPGGRLVGVDLSPKMLDVARRRVERAGWKNVELVQGDIASYSYPGGVNAVLSIGVLGYINDFDRVIKSAFQAIVPGGRIVVLDGKRPERLPSWIFNPIVWVSRPFGVTRAYFDKPIWESVVRYFQETTLEQMYGGMIYISSGTAGPRTVEQPDQAADL